MKTDAEVRRMIDKACTENAGKYLREFAEEVIGMRRRIAKLEKRQRVAIPDSIDCDDEESDDPPNA